MGVILIQTNTEAKPESNVKSNQVDHYTTGTKWKEKEKEIWNKECLLLSEHVKLMNILLQRKKHQSG